MRRITLLLTLITATALSACGTETEIPTEGDPIDNLASLGSYNLEADDGEVDDGDEAEAADILAEEFPNDDDAAGDEEEPELVRAPNARVHRVRLLWGQLRGNPDVEQPTDWSGSISVDRGAIGVVRTVRFEANDGVDRPRPDRQTINITSHTRPHHDGLVLVIADAANGEANALHIDLGPASYDIPVADLDGMRELVRVDRAGNIAALQGVMIRDGEPQQADCAQGFLQGRWRRTAENRGRFAGRWVTDDGETDGFVAGIYGVRANGDHVMVGKYFDPQGGFRGRLLGTYTPGEDGEGHFEARWVGRGGEQRGALRGEYITGQRPGTGFFRGGWANAACRAEAQE